MWSTDPRWTFRSGENSLFLTSPHPVLFLKTYLPNDHPSILCSMILVGEVLLGCSSVSQGVQMQLVWAGKSWRSLAPIVARTTLSCLQCWRLLPHTMLCIQFRELFCVQILWWRLCASLKQMPFGQESVQLLDARSTDQKCPFRSHQRFEWQLPCHFHQSRTCTAVFFFGNRASYLLPRIFRNTPSCSWDTENWKCTVFCRQRNSLSSPFSWPVWQQTPPQPS